MKEITLTNGSVSYVDDDDYEKLSAFPWKEVKDKKTSYAAFSPIKGIIVKMPSLIIGIAPRGKVTDHKDGNGLNNQKTNLRFVTIRQNQQNRRHGVRSSKYPGVRKHKSHGLFEASCKVNGKRRYLGWFKKEEDAFLAYKEFIEVLGETVLFPNQVSQE